MTGLLLTKRRALPRAFDLSRPGYYLDFALAPLTATALILFEGARGAGWTLALTAPLGFVAWTLAEYVIHRALFHGVPLLRPLHDVHHNHPRGYAGVASWGSLGSFALIWLTLRLAVGATLANGLSAGLLLGYVCYIAVHDAFHHGDRRRFSRYTRFMHRAHTAHHRGAAANYGVTSPVWDLVFGTYARPQ